MKALFLFGLLSLTTFQAGADALPSGRFEGQGLWNSASANGDYQVRATVTANKIDTSYTLKDGSTKVWNFEMAPAKNGFFKVISSGASVGDGYCLEKAPVCHYEVRIGDFSLEETLTFSDGKLYRFGSKTQSGDQIRWQEALEKK